MKTLIMALGLALASNIALAQPPVGPKGADRANMQKELGLTDEQVEKMREIREAGGGKDEMRAVLTPEQQAKAAELKKARGDRMKEYLGLSDEQEAQIQQIRKDGGSREEIRAVLTPEQQAKFDKSRSMVKGKGPRAGD